MMSRQPAAEEPPFLTLRGRGTSPGLACGPLLRNHPEVDPARAANSILVARRAVPDDVGRILAAAGTLTLSGAVLSHVSLLSREFGKPSVALTMGSKVCILEEEGRNLLELSDVGEVSGAWNLEQGDVVLLDGERGLVQVPGGPNRDARLGIRRLHKLLLLYAKQPGDASLLDEIFADMDVQSEAFSFLLEAALEYRRVPPGEPARQLIDWLRTQEPGREVAHAHLERLAGRVLRRAELRCQEALETARNADDQDELAQAVRHLERSLRADRALLSDLGSPTEPLQSCAAPVLAEAQARSESLRAALRKQVTETLELPDESLRHRIGMLYQLLRRARTSGLEVELVDPLHARLSEQVARERERTGAHLVVPLKDDGLQPRSLVGGKAAGLFQVGKVLPPGCRIPRGFVVTTSAYRLHLLGQTGERLRQVAEDTEDVVVVSRRARAALLSGEIPSEVAAAIGEGLSELGPVRLAVRSSSTVEDSPVGSLAGQFDTYLGVQGKEELLKRIRWAWASLWNARALRTLAASDVSALRASQAVLVQEVVETRAAGVLFSRDPSGRADTILVNASWGLGEGVSQGEIAGDLYWVRRSTGELVARELGSGKIQIVLDPERTGTLEVELPLDRAGTPCLGEEDLTRLAELARTLEKATGRGQDVEFGFAEDGSLVVFQVRRIVPRRTE